MKEANETNPTPLSKTSNIEELSDYWETHSLSDYWDQTQEVSFDVKAKRKRRISLSIEIYSEIEV